MASEIFYSFLRDLINGENFLLYRSSESGEASLFELRRYYINVMAIFNSVLEKSSKLRSKSIGSYWILLEYAQSLLDRAEKFTKGKDPRTLSSHYRDGLLRLKETTSRLVKAAHCEAALSGAE